MKPEEDEKNVAAELNVDAEDLEAMKNSAAEIHRRAGRMLSDAFFIGAELKKIRDRLRAKYPGDTHGRWHRWLDDYVKYSRRTATRLIDVYDKYSERYGGAGDVAPPSLTFSVLAVLAKPGADPEAVAAIEREIDEDKEVPTAREAEERVRKTLPRDGPETRHRKNPADKQSTIENANTEQFLELIKETQQAPGIRDATQAAFRSEINRVERALLRARIVAVELGIEKQFDQETGHVVTGLRKLMANQAN